MGKWAVVKKRQSVSLWASGAGSQEAEVSVWAESSNAHEGRWCPHTGHTAATQQCGDQNSQPPLTLPGERFLPSTAASLSFSMALTTASCIRELLGISMTPCSHCTWDFSLQWCLWRREQHTPRHGLSQHLWPQIYQLQPSSAAKTQSLLMGIWIATDSLGSCESEDKWSEEQVYSATERSKPAQQEQAANTAPQQGTNSSPFQSKAVSRT